MSSQFDASSNEQVEKRKIQSKILQQSRINGLKKLAGDKDGRAWLWQFLDQANPFADPFHMDSNIMAHNCGAKIMPTQIVDQLLQHCPTEYALMKKEAYEKPEPLKEKKDD